jgi:hypothetical protein
MIPNEYNARLTSLFFLENAPRSLSDLPTMADAISPQKGNENTYRAAELRDLHHKAPTRVRRKLVIVGSTQSRPARGNNVAQIGNQLFFEALFFLSSFFSFLSLLPSFVRGRLILVRLFSVLCVGDRDVAPATEHMNRRGTMIRILPRFALPWHKLPNAL